MRKYIPLILVITGLLLVPNLISAEGDKVNLIVGYDNAIQKANINAIMKIGGNIKYDWTELNMVAIRDLPKGLQKNIENIPGVRVFEDNLVYALALDESAALINSDDVWAQGVTGNGIRVCVVDTGVGPHSDLNVVAEYDFYNNDNDASDDHGHGTHCAGIVASAHNTYKGNAPGADIMAAKTINSQGSGYESDTVDGILWCAKGPDGVYGTGDEADVITISLGFSLHSGTCDSQPAANAANTAVANGVFVVAASGNDCSETQIGNPACGSGVMSVGAVYDDNVGSKSWCCNWMCSSYCTDSTTNADKIVCFSNGNSQLDVVAPGSVITSLAPNNGIDDMSGTSMSTPHVAGIAALMLEENPALTPYDIRMWIRNTSVDLGQPFNRQGYGRVDAYAAWQAVSGGCTSNEDCYDGNECTEDICNTETGECSNPPVADNTPCGVEGNVCCSGTCTTPYCSIDIDCDDSESCTTDICYFAGTCTAYCESTWAACDLIVSDGCCGPACDWINDIDCPACGDGYCAGSANGEDCNTCPADCISGQGGTCDACFKGVCDGSCHPRKEGPDCADCAPSYCCGDGTCEGAEDVNYCFVDCGCTSDADCNDGESCTTDVCNAGVCENTWPSCGISDGCCGPTCDPGNDPDCPDCSACFKGVCDGSCHPRKEGLDCPDCQ
ncbi:MAG: S8 family serine peptidase [Candidatus Woesearchaeota archaeon]|nr:MAG: S8 family serine peptidase [Candidatus Woesearchaeota archaeon]